MKILEKWQRKVRRLRWPESLRHMSKVKDQLVLVDAGKKISIVWEEQIICEAVSIRSLRNTRTGRVKIIASGPSIREIPADYLLSEPENNLYVNGAFNITEGAPFSGLYMATDTDFISQRFDIVAEVLKSDCFFFTTSDGIATICDMSLSALKNSKCRIVIFDIANRGYLKPKVSWDIFRQVHRDNDEIIFHPDLPNIGLSVNAEHGVFCGRTVTFRALQVALHLGFSEIFIFGMDLGGSRFYNEGSNAQPSNLDKDFYRSIAPSFDICQHPVVKGKALIANCSMHSRLPEESLQKVDWRTI